VTEPQRYWFKFRGHADPPEIVEIEAGPFTPLQAHTFAQSEAAKRCMTTGRVWTCDYGLIAETESEIELNSFSDFAAAGLVVIILTAIVVSLFQYHADKVCEERAKNEASVTLCRGRAYATGWAVLGDGDTCGCLP